MSEVMPACSDPRSHTCMQRCSRSSLETYCAQRVHKAGPAARQVGPSFMIAAKARSPAVLYLCILHKSAYLHAAMPQLWP